MPTTRDDGDGHRADQALAGVAVARLVAALLGGPEGGLGAEGGGLAEGHDAPDQRELAPLVEAGGEDPAGGADRAVLAAHGGAPRLAPAHHHALGQRLAPDGSDAGVDRLPTSHVLGVPLRADHGEQSAVGPEYYAQ